MTERFITLRGVAVHNLKSIDLRFSGEELEQLDKASALPPEYPGWMLEFTGGDRKLNA